METLSTYVILFTKYYCMVPIYFILTETISAMHLLVFPLSSLIVIGLSSFILSRAAGQSNYAEIQR